MLKKFFDNLCNGVIDYFIADDPYDYSTVKAQNNKTDMCKTCDKCKYSVRVLAPSNPPTWNIKCTHPIGDILIPAGKIVKFRSASCENIERPSWCPLITKESREAEVEANKAMRKTPKRWNKGGKPYSYDIEQALKKYKPKLKLTDIKVGDIIHIPPTPNDERMDVKITNKYVYSASGTVVGNEGKTVYIYENGLKALFASKKDKSVYEV